METVQPTRLLVAGPHLPETQALNELLTQQQVIVVVGEMLDISGVPELIRLRRPDVVLLRARETEFALDAILLILTQVPDAKLLVVTNTYSHNDASLMLVHGARGVLAVGDSYAQGVRAICAVHAGEIWGARGVLSQIILTATANKKCADAQSKILNGLTARECEIVNMLRIGSSNKEIASRLSISDKTVKTHLQNIYGKLDVHRRHKISAALLS